MLVADFGRFVLKSDTALAATLPVEEASVYECLTLKGRDISAYVVDGDFTFAALEEQAAKQQAADPAEGSAVSEAIGQVRLALTYAVGLHGASQQALDSADGSAVSMATGQVGISNLYEVGVIVPSLCTLTLVGGDNLQGSRGSQRLSHGL